MEDSIASDGIIIDLIIERKHGIRPRGIHIATWQRASVDKRTSKVSQFRLHLVAGVFWKEHQNPLFPSIEFLFIYLFKIYLYRVAHSE